MRDDPKGQDDFLRAKLDLALLENDLERRDFARVRPSPEEPVRVVVEGESQPVRDIGQGGLSLELGPLVGPGWLLRCDLLLPHRVLPLPVVLEVTHRDERGLTRARFRDLDADGSRVVGEYVHRRRQQILGQDA